MPIGYDAFHSARLRKDDDDGDEFVYFAIETRKACEAT